MAEFDARMVTVRRVEYAVGNPTVAEEFGKAFACIEKTYSDMHSGRNATGNIQVRATDTEIILFFDLDERTGPLPTQKSRVPVLTDDFLLRDTKRLNVLT